MGLPVNGDTITRVGAQAATASMGGGWLASVMSWDWGNISFIVGTLVALATFAWNAYYKRKEYLLKEKALANKLEYFEFKLPKE